MRRGAWFWGTMLIVVGVIFLLGTTGLLPVDAGKIVWPVALIVIGLWILWGAFGPRRSVQTEHVTIPLEGAAQARLKVRHGAGRLAIRGGAPAGVLLSGDFGGGVDYRARREGDALDVKLRLPESGFPGPWMWERGGLEWTFALNTETPLELDFRLGANEATLDLNEVRASLVRLETGASKTTLTLPAAAGYTRVELRSGMGAVFVSIPVGVAARIRAQGGLAGIHVDTARFPMIGEKTYQSADYATATNRVDLDAETGVGALEIR